MKKIKCHLIIESYSPHLNQLYAGFIELHKKKIIDLTYEKRKIIHNESYLVVQVNNKKVVYDTYDSGERFIPNIDLENVDFYFKRSYNSDICNNISEKIFPLGLNYDVKSKKGNFTSLKNELYLLSRCILKKERQKFYIDDFEWYPSIYEEPKICFLTRVWDPYAKEVENELVSKERININKFRIECIDRCTKEFGSNFLGGIQNTKYARENFPEYIINDDRITKRSNFINTIKDYDICIATTGLHGSIGWKFAEYVANSRAVVSEKLQYELPGKFHESKNYMEFSTPNELIEKLYILKDNKKLRYEMMKANNEYYNNSVRPDKLILNTLLRTIY